MKLNRPIYLDNQSTTPVDPRVLKKIIPYYNEKFGNESIKEKIIYVVANNTICYVIHIVKDCILLPSIMSSITFGLNYIIYVALSPY